MQGCLYKTKRDDCFRNTRYPDGGQGVKTACERRGDRLGSCQFNRALVCLYINIVACNRSSREGRAWFQIATFQSQVLVLETQGAGIVKAQGQTIGGERGKLIGKEGEGGLFPCTDLDRFNSAADPWRWCLAVERGQTAPGKGKCEEQQSDSTGHLWCWRVRARWTVTFPDYITTLASGWNLSDWVGDGKIKL